MPNKIGRRAFLGAGAALGSLATGAGLLAQSASALTPNQYVFNGKKISPSELSRTTGIGDNPDAVYLNTELLGRADQIQVFSSMDDLGDEFRGTILSDSICKMKEQISRGQRMQGTITAAGIQAFQQEHASLSGRANAIAEADASPPRTIAAVSLLPRPYAGYLYEDDNFQGRSTQMTALMPDASWINFDNIASSAKFSGFATFSDLSYYRGSKLVLLYLYTASIPSLSVFRTVHGVSWNDLISSWAVVSY
jgi:hypothetical protein